MLRSTRPTGSVDLMWLKQDQLALTRKRVPGQAVSGYSGR